MYNTNFELRNSILLGNDVQMLFSRKRIGYEDDSNTGYIKVYDSFIDPNIQTENKLGASANYDNVLFTDTATHVLTHYGNGICNVAVSEPYYPAQTPAETYPPCNEETVRPARIGLKITKGGIGFVPFIARSLFETDIIEKVKTV